MMPGHTDSPPRVKYKCVEGWHILESDDLPGFYIANRDFGLAIAAVQPAIEKLRRLDADGSGCSDN